MHKSIGAAGALAQAQPGPLAVRNILGVGGLSVPVLLPVEGLKD